MNISKILHLSTKYSLVSSYNFEKLSKYSKFIIIESRYENKL